MNYRKMADELPKENTTIWICTKENCKGWMRADFAFESIPTCPLCQSPMESVTKMLPQLINSSHDWKTAKKKGSD